MLRQVQRPDDFPVVLPGSRADHPAGGGVGVLVAFHAAQPVHQVFRYQQKIRHALQPAGEFVRVQLVDGVERLELNPCTPVEV